MTADGNNHLSGLTYDPSSNTLTDGANTYTWDAESQMKTAAGVTYTYDGDGKRIMKSNGTIYWYGMNSDALMETDLNNNWLYAYYFFNGKRVARNAPGNIGVDWYFTDALGSSRTVWSTSSLDQSDFYPFGGERVLTSANSNHYKFTGKERDSESGLDNFGARYNSSTLGRFMSPDPLLNSGQPWNPQSWNRYSYTENNPLRYTDPTGLWKFGSCSGSEDECEAYRQRFRNSVDKAKAALKGLDPNSKEAKALKGALDKIGEEGKGDLKVNFGDAGKTDGEPNLGRTIGHAITINFGEIDSEAKDFNLSKSETAALDAGVTTHEATHALGNGLLGLFQGHFEHPAYYTESATYQGLHNTDRPLNLWNESWLTVDKDKLSIEKDREHSIQQAIHPKKQEQKQGNPQ
jgi:RHS repeat-associated protein